MSSLLWGIYAYTYIFKNSNTHHLYITPDFIQETRLNAKHSIHTSHLRKCSGYLAAPRLGEIVQKPLLTDSKTLKRSTLKSCGSDVWGNMWQKEEFIYFDISTFKKKHQTFIFPGQIMMRLKLLVCKAVYKPI